MRTIRIAATLLVAAAVFGVAGAIVASVPVGVPDTCSPAVSNHEEPLRPQEVLGQSFVPRRSNLDSVSVVLGLEEGSTVSTLLFTLRGGGPTGRLLRTVEVPASSLPRGRAMSFHPTGLEERWQTFSFEPVTGSAGKTLWFALEARGGHGGDGLRVLMNFHSRYAAGEAYQDGEPINANVLFRTHARGLVADYVSLVATNAAAAVAPSFFHPAGAALYLLAAIIYPCLIAALTVAAIRLARGSTSE